MIRNIFIGLYAIVSVCLVFFALYQFLGIANFDGNGEAPAFWRDYIGLCLLPAFTGAAMIVLQEVYTLEDFVIDTLDRIFFGVSWPRWSTVVLSTLAALFTAWAISWESYQRFTWPAAVLFGLVPLWRTVCWILERDRRRAQKADRHVHTSPWSLDEM